jgi:hypothetical protein
MSDNYINLTADNLAKEHLCCAIADKNINTVLMRKCKY